MNEKPLAILVVDDEIDTCANLSDIFAEFGYHVDVAYDGPSALELVARNHYDVALLDLKMPGMDGLELYRRIKVMRSGTVAIIVTAYASHDTAKAAEAAGAWRILSKPVNVQRLFPLVTEAMEQPLVMVVDDDSDLCESLWDLFRERNLRVCIAHSVAEAEDRLKLASYRVVLIDLRLPIGNGGEVYRLVRDINPQARTILITGYRAEMGQSVDQAISKGVDAVCYKPFDVTQLLETVERLSR